jgi:G3E family GTPase
MKPSARAGPRAIPLTVIGGFLGAGKTTLVNATLAQARARRLAILVNDFGELAIDAALISHRSARTIALANGCVCCSLVGGLAQALLDVLRLDPPPHHVLVEASGVSDPRRIAQIARAERAFAQDATIVLVAADQIRALARDRYVGDTVLRQLASADLVVVNKADLAAEADVDAIEAWLSQAAVGARVARAVGAKLPLDLVLGPTSPRAHAGARRDHAAARRDAQHEHARVFATRTLRCASPVSETAMRRALETLPDGVLRAKGFVRFDTDPDAPKLIQAVGARWSIDAAHEACAGGESVLVVIGVAHALERGELGRLAEAFSG